MSTATWTKRIALGIAVAAFVAPAAQARVVEDPPATSVPPATVAAPADTSDTAGIVDYKSSYEQLHEATLLYFRHAPKKHRGR